jgi:predicted NUDIX family NTP pyrophosphohydrolase
MARTMSNEPEPKAPRVFEGHLFTQHGDDASADEAEIISGTVFLFDWPERDGQMHD